MQLADIQVRGGFHYSYSGRLPCVNVKVQHGLESVTDAQWNEIADDVPEGFSLENAQRLADADKHGDAWRDACTQGFEGALMDAQALFGVKSSDVRLVGRSGGWLCVRGLPELDDLDPELDDSNDADNATDGLAWNSERYARNNLPKLAGSRVEGAPALLAAIAEHGGDTLLARWQAFCAFCADYVSGVPYDFTWDLAHNAWTRECEEKAEVKAEADLEARTVALLQSVANGDAFSDRRGHRDEAQSILDARRGL